jgi:hypothetical protein
MAIKVKRANARNLNGTVTRDDVAENITGWTITMACKKKQGNSNTEVVFPIKTATIVSAVGGTFRIALTSSNTDLPANVYYCDIKAVDGSGNPQNSQTFTLEITETITD